ncbi:glycerate kinase type-2 family protein [Rubripirellula lacrimiformis]|uniref:glycerate kinase type-2 family protein n=1 Tax=Rubripirellula lacrimiformis TaxID=1930273 RepID=UPI001FEA9C78|nr:DUF4147 domain-containing protein [Rubripirellula lacrimiformis]
MNKPRQDATEIWTAGVDSVRAEGLVRREVQVDGDVLSIHGHAFDRSDFDRIVVVGAGKAAVAMATGFVGSAAAWRPITGWVNAPEGTMADAPSDQQVGGIRLHPARPAGVNEPTPAGVLGTGRILDLVAAASPRDLCVALISGGGSALMPAPADGVLLADKLAVTRFLSSAGADIVQLNTVRKHLSAVKGGGILRRCRAGHLVTLVLSDVLGDPLDLIASGPTVADTSTAKDAIDVLRRFDPDRELPAAIYQTLEAKQQAADAVALDNVAGAVTDPSIGREVPNSVFVIGNNAVAVDEAGIQAESLGYNHVMQVARQCEGAAEDVGHHLAKMIVGMLRSDPADHRLDCLITGGEPVVALAPPETRGRGGRNQQLVLAAYEALLKIGLRSEEWDRLCLLSGGTDGEDGPTDAAGAILDGDVHRRAQALEWNVADTLARNDAYTFFDAAGGLLITGPTGTNVCDVRVALVSPPN